MARWVAAGSSMTSSSSVAWTAPFPTRSLHRWNVLDGDGWYPAWLAVARATQCSASVRVIKPQATPLFSEHRRRSTGCRTIKRLRAPWNRVTNASIVRFGTR